MNAATYRKDLMKALRANAHRHDLWSVWSDFVGMCAIALSNTVDLRQRAAAALLRRAGWTVRPPEGRQE